MEAQQHDERANMPAWLADELEGYRFFDVRLTRRMQELARQLWSHLGQSIPMACQDWANTRVAYRFLDNADVHAYVILEGHCHATRERFKATTDSVLILHDTPHFTFQRDDQQPIGITYKTYGGQDKEGRHKARTLCGILMHSNLAVTPEGLPLGLTAVKFWNRKQFKGCTAFTRKINPTRVPIEAKESFRWLDNLQQSTALCGNANRCVHIGDRESDISELFCLTRQLDTHFLVRTCVDRLAGDGHHAIADEMAGVRVRSLHRVEVGDCHGNVSTAVLELRFKRIHLLPPIGKQAEYPDLTLTVLHATECGKPVGRDRIDWKLLTDLPVTSRMQAIEMLQWYATRRKIETFPKIMKSGCKVKQPKLRTSERLVNLIAALLHPGLAYLLDDHDAAYDAYRAGNAGIHRARAEAA
jgi:hypothetical protein